ncbi:MAG: plasmid partitioning protein RepB C-terminal domain-containing protein, partial [Octadecabacter sp.]
MKPTVSEQTIAAAFERELIHISFKNIALLYLVTPQTKATVKYGQIVASIQEIGLVEPLVVARDRHDPKMYTLLDGHLR